MTKRKNTKPTTSKNPVTDAYRAIKPENPIYALGLAVRLLLPEPAFEKLGFTQWSGILAGMIERGHYFFVVKDGDIEGLVGWALTDQQNAEKWLAGEGKIASDNYLDGDCIIINVWEAKSPQAHRFMEEHLHRLEKQRAMIYAKRYYPDGRVRPVKVRVAERNLDPEMALTI